MATPAANPASVDGLTGRGLEVGSQPGQTPEGVAEFRLGEAWRALQDETRARGFDVAAAMSRGDVAAGSVADVVEQAAMRVLRNPDGASEESESIDDWRGSRKLADASQDVYFTAAELRRVTPSYATASPSAGSIPYT